VTGARERLPAQRLVRGRFREDRDMITAQARNLALDPQRPMLPLHMDAALRRFRQCVAQALAQEQAR
jgi:vanillate O-demethylase monooxygenase subunit